MQTNSDLGQQIKERLKAEKMSVPELASILAIPKDRIYKWQKGAKPSDMADYLKVTRWLESVPHGTKSKVFRQEHDPAMFTTPITTDRRTTIAQPLGEDPLVIELKSRIIKLEADNDWLRKQNERLMSLLDSSVQKS